MAVPPHAFRRAFHLASPVFLSYYAFPADFGNGITRQAVLILALGTALAVEAARISLRIPVFGMRTYEAGRLSAYAWGAIGLAIGLLFFPPQVVVPVFCGMAWIDPLCAWSRSSGRYPWLPALGYAAVFVATSGAGVALLGLDTLTPVETGVLAGLATPIALLAEYPQVHWVDDDFLMTMAPLLLLGGVFPWVSALP